MHLKKQVKEKSGLEENVILKTQDPEKHAKQMFGNYQQKRFEIANKPDNEN